MGFYGSQWENQLPYGIIEVNLFFLLIVSESDKPGFVSKF